jgi:chemotaxis protein MotB
MADNEQPIIIKKIVKGGHGHHGGAWKVAYADFVTAMMAFFLLMWLLNATTDDQKKGIADYFTPATASDSKSGAGGLLGGQSVSSPGAMQSATSVPSASIDLKPTSGASDGDAEEDVGSTGNEDLSKLSDEELREALVKREAEMFDEAEKNLRQAIEEIPELKELAKNLVIDQTPEGLRIQIVDREGKPMFPSGSADMLPHTRKLMAKIAQVVASTKNKISIAGHTDSTPFRGKRAGSGNWELSSGRALSSRRALVAGGLVGKRIVQVVGKADTEPLLKDDPKSARNRRISIVLLREGGTLGPSEMAKLKTRKSTEFKRNWTGPRLR